MKKGYKIIMMSKHEIPIEAEEVKKVLRGIAEGSPVVLKQGIFNPSAYSCIIEDNTRMSKIRETNEIGQYTGNYITHYEELPNIFAGIQELSALKTSDIKKLGRDLQ